MSYDVFADSVGFASGTQNLFLSSRGQGGDGIRLVDWDVVVEIN